MFVCVCVLCYVGAVAERTAQEQAKVSSSYPSIMKKRGYEQSNGLDGKLPFLPRLHFHHETRLRTKQQT